MRSGPPTVATYAKTLLDHIQKQKAQSKANTTSGRGRSYRYGDDTILWRTDGYLKPFR
jgi:hypothetical protein